MLQSFIQSMLPKNAKHVFGKGTAGEVWKSMLAEKLGAEIARSGQVGLAKRLAAGRLEMAAANPSPPIAVGRRHRRDRHRATLNARAELNDARHCRAAARIASASGRLPSTAQSSIWAPS